MPYTTVADLIKVLQTFDPETPLEGFVEGTLMRANNVYAHGVFPNKEGKYRHVEISFWEEHHIGCIDKTGSEWDGWDEPKIDKEWFLPYKEI